MGADNINIVMPLMGEGVNEATVVRWLKGEGDRVQKDEPLLEVSTDKVDTEITASDNGFLIGIFATPGSTVQVDEVIAQLGESKNTPVQKPMPRKSNPNSKSESTGEKKSAPSFQINKDHLNHSMQGSSPAALPSTQAGMVRSSPLVRKMATDAGVSLSNVQGTGLYGRITKDDLQQFLLSGNNRIPQYREQASSSLPHSQRYKRNVLIDKENNETLDGVQVKRTPMSKIRRLTAEHMVDSVRIAPHVTTTFEIDLSNVVHHKKNTPSKLTYTAYFIWAASKALKEFPEVNAVVDGEDILFRDAINIGCAVATENGLIVPVLKNCQGMSLDQISTNLNQLVDKARNKKLAPADIKGGTFSITNPGIYGSLHSQPIINQPQSAIMSVGAMLPKPVVFEEDEIKIRTICQVGLTFDHRLIDGEQGAKFLAHLKKTLENITTSSS